MGTEGGVVELFLIVGLGAVVVTVLKGHPWYALGVIALGGLLVAALVVRGDSGAADVSLLTQVLLLGGFPLWGLAAVVAATRPAVAMSPWERRRAVDASGHRILDAEPPGRRFARSLAGAAIGALPAIAFMALVIAVAETGDQAQLAFLGLPIGAFGTLIGGWIGYTWVPRRSVPPAGHHPEPSSPQPVG